jgi:hypothetical protein
MNYPVPTPELVSLAAYVAEDGLLGKRGPLDLQTLYASVRGNARAKSGRGWEGGWGEGMGDFWNSIGNVNEENT